MGNAHGNEPLSGGANLSRLGRNAKEVEEDGEKGQNYLFYMNQIPSVPDGYLISEWHKRDKALSFNLLERHHGFIQWFFPVFENAGMNFDSKSLGKKEAKCIRENVEASKRVVQTYKLMLNFYGMKLADSRTGAVARAEHYEERYSNIERHPHNNLRISRIIVSLGELGFHRYKKPLVDFLKHEIEVEGELGTCQDSLIRFWIPLLNEESEAYIRKTKETPEDREEGILFKMLAQGSEEAEKIFDEFDATGPYVEEPKESKESKESEQQEEVIEKKEEQKKEKPVPIHLKDLKLEEEAEE